MAQTATTKEKATWLKQHVQEGPTAGPYKACIKFADVLALLQEQYGGDITTAEVSYVLREAFPNAATERTTYVNGIRLRHLRRDRTPSLVPPPRPVIHMSATVSQIQLQTENTRLKARVAELELENRQLVQVGATLEQQMQRLCSSSCLLLHGPDTLERFQHFSIDAIIAEIKQFAPDLLHLFNRLGDVRRNALDGSDDLAVEEIKALTALCTLINAKSRMMKGLQLFMGMMLVARGTSRQAITAMNHAGLSMSYTKTWEYLKKLSNEAHYKDQVKEGNWIWVYDNFNLHQKIRHEREDRHNVMYNTTTRLAISIDNLPPFNFSWADTTPQKSRGSLEIDEIYPNLEDGRQLFERAVQFVTQVLVEEFPNLADLKQFVAMPRSTPAHKSTIVPMSLLFKDEKYVDENIQILQEYMRECSLNGNSQVFVGDQATCKTIRGAKQWVECEVNEVDKLKWAHEVPGDFHFLWECARVLLQAYWGNPTTVGSLCHLRNYINRGLVDQTGKVFNIADEFLIHTFKAHLIAAMCRYLGIVAPTDRILHTCSQEWLEKAAKGIVESRIMPIESIDDPVYSLHRSFLYCGFLYVDLRNAIRNEEGSDIIRLWKHWAILFLAMNKKNYAKEAFNLLANIHATFPKHIAHIVVHNRTVNTQGKKGHGKPIDQMLEHYNLVIKQAMKASGSNLTKTHMVDVSLCGLLLLDAARKVDSALKTPFQAGHHTTSDPSQDIQKMVTCLLEERVTCDAQRKGTRFECPQEKGSNKMGEAFVRYVQGNDEDEDDVDIEEAIMDIDYELSLTD